jgi:hypothetical protein
MLVERPFLFTCLNEEWTFFRVEVSFGLDLFIELDLRRPRAFYAGEVARPPFSGQGMWGSVPEAPTVSSIATA